MKLVTSNPRKLAEFKRMADAIGADVIGDLEMAAGVDLPEVDGSAEDVVVQKALLAGPGTIVEDTILEVDGEEVVDIRWRISEMGQVHAKARWVVSVAANDGDVIKVYRGIVEGEIDPTRSMPENAFGFDPYFVPDQSGGRSLHDLEMVGLKDRYSARFAAIKALCEGRPDFTRSIDAIPVWRGGWQRP